MISIRPSSLPPALLSHSVTDKTQVATDKIQVQAPTASTAQTEGAKNTQEANASSKTGVVDEFLKWSQMSPAERIRAQYLKEHDLTEEGLKALPPEESTKIEAAIAEQIKQQLGGGDNQPTGLVFNQLA